MPGMRNAVACVAMGSALLFQAAHAAPPETFAPPAEFSAYVAQVRAADAVQGDEARCKAHPDLPGNRWVPGAGQARCTLLRAPAWTLDQIAKLAATDEGVAELERNFRTLLDAHYRDPSQREQIFVAFRVFDESPRAGDVAQRWLKAAPKSPFAKVAAADHFSRSGWKARGARWASETPQSHLDRMTGYFAQAMPLYMEALELEPRLSVACYELASIGRQSADALQGYASSHCLKVDPDSYHVWKEQVEAANPKWGGSDAQLRQAVADAAARAGRNPLLGTLLGAAVGYDPSMTQDYGLVVEDLATAAKLGPDGTLMSKTGLGYLINRDLWRAFVYYSQALRYWPNNVDYRVERASVLGDLGDDQWERADMEVALKLQPDNPFYQLTMAKLVEKLESPAAARPYYRRAMSGDQHQQAMERYCATFMLPTVDPQANACTRALVKAFPLSVNGWYLRTWAASEHDVAAVPGAAARFRALASPDNPQHQGWLARVNAFEAQQKSRPQSPAAATRKKSTTR